MKTLFYKDWYGKRVQKIVSIFGKTWFQGKSILELGACYGDIGSEFLELGADVTFSDARSENLEEIKNKLIHSGFIPNLDVTNQNLDYDLNRRFDLILHLGVLYHVENWKNDLTCALNHSNIMILETRVNPDPSAPEKYPVIGQNIYGAYNCESPIFSQEEIEDHLTSLNCKFIRFDDPDLNINWGWLNAVTVHRSFYDWSYESYNLGTYNDPKNTSYNFMTNFRRMWLVLK